MVESQVDPNEAPAGFYAVSKASAKPADGSNICRACDWRPQCQDPTTDLTAPGHRCMGYGVRIFDGRTIERKDGSSVVFKKSPN